MNTPISQQVQVEIEELHQFFEDWFTGRLPKTDEAYSRFKDALAEDFVIVSPGGHSTECKALLQGLWDAHNTHETMRIWIENIKLRKVRSGIVWASYEEWQELGNNTTGRQSTVIFSRQSDDPPSLKWELVHETWLPGK